MKELLLMSLHLLFKSCKNKDYMMNNGKNPDSMYSDSKHSGYLHEINSVDDFEVNIVTLFIGCTCGKPVENYPFQQPVFDWLKKYQNTL